MNDWLEVIRQVLRDGLAVQIDIHIRTEKPEKGHVARCESCDWRATYDSAKAAQRALRAHHQHCTANAQQMQWIAQVQDQESQDH